MERPLTDFKHGGMTKIDQACLFVAAIRQARGDAALEALSSRLFMALITEFDRGFRAGWEASRARN